MLSHSDQSTLPPVFVADAEFEALCEFANGAFSPGAALLQQELERATIVSRDEGPNDFVRLNATVEFTDLVSARTRTITLVAPGEADMDVNRLSVLAPAGAALLGLRPGDTFRWTTFDGRPRSLAVNRIVRFAASVLGGIS
jgi:regulator of nucleoside diphosphate kinase